MRSSFVADARILAGMATIRPRIVLCALGGWSDWLTVDETVARVAGGGYARDAEYSVLEPDDRMRRAFDASMDRVEPSLTDEDWRAIDEHRAVAYVLSPPIDGGTDVAAMMLRLGAALLDAGAVALKCESSGIAHGTARWRSLAADVESGDTDTAGVALYHAWVRRPLGGENGMLYTTAAACTSSARATQRSRPMPSRTSSTPSPGSTR